MSFSRSKRFAEVIHGASGPGPAAYDIKRLFDVQGFPKPKQPKTRKQRQALPMLLGNLEPAKTTRVKTMPVEQFRGKDWTELFQPHGRIGEGATGIVYAGKLKDGTPCAMKRILNPQSTEHEIQEFYGEFEMMNKCHHANIAAVWCACEVPFPAFLMELLDMTLAQSTKRVAIDDEGILVAFAAAADAVSYLHANCIAHRDVKPHNMCHVTKNSWNVKLLDFDAAELKEPCVLKDKNLFLESSVALPATLHYSPCGDDLVGCREKLNGWSLIALDAFAVGKTFGEIVEMYGQMLSDDFRTTFRAITSALMHPDADLLQALNDAKAVKP